MKGKVTEVTMETSCFIVEMTSQGSKNFQKQEDTQTAVRGRSLGLDQLKEDGIRKELYKAERKSEEYWNKRWRFLKHSKKLEEEERVKQGLRHEIADLKSSQQMASVAPGEKKPTFELVPSKKVPIKTSGMIGWRLFTPKNELNRLVGPMYISPKSTMNPPPGPDEPDLTQQRIIFLG